MVVRPRSRRVLLLAVLLLQPSGVSLEPHRLAIACLGSLIADAAFAAKVSPHAPEFRHRLLRQDRAALRLQGQVRRARVDQR